MSIQFKHEVKYNDIIGFLEVHEKMLKINTSSNNTEINFNDIKFAFLNQNNGNELIIGLNDNTTMSLYLLDSGITDYSYMLNYINSSVIEGNSQGEDTGSLSKTQSNEEISNINKNDLQMSMPASISINKNDLYNLHEESFIKKDLSTMKSNLKTDGEFSVYDNYISIDTQYYELNIPYNLLNDIELNDLVTKLYTLKLNNGSLIHITSKNTDVHILRQTYNFINDKLASNTTYNNKEVYPIQNNHLIQQQYPQQNMAPHIQQPYLQSNYQQATSYQIPHNQKSKLIVIILHIIFPGLGYAYMNRWGKFIITPIAILVTAALRTFFENTLNYMLYTDPSASGIWLTEDIVSGLSILIILIWIYTLINSVYMVDKYNKGLPY